MDVLIEFAKTVLAFIAFFVFFSAIVALFNFSLYIVDLIEEFLDDLSDRFLR